MKFCTVNKTFYILIPTIITSETGIRRILFTKDGKKKKPRNSTTVVGNEKGALSGNIPAGINDRTSTNTIHETTPISTDEKRIEKYPNPRSFFEV